jgi:hypothetical protein
MSNFIKNKQKIAEMVKKTYGTIIPIIVVKKYLHGVSFPSDRQELLTLVKQNKASYDVLTTIKRLPDKNYYSVFDITQEISNKDNYQ